MHAKRGPKGLGMCGLLECGLGMYERGNHEPPPSVHHRRTIGAPLQLRLSPVTCTRVARVAALGPRSLRTKG